MIHHPGLSTSMDLVCISGRLLSALFAGGSSSSVETATGASLFSPSTPLDGSVFGFGADVGFGVNDVDGRVACVLCEVTYGHVSIAPKAQPALRATPQKLSRKFLGGPRGKKHQKNQKWAEGPIGLHRGPVGIHVDLFC